MKPKNNNGSKRARENTTNQQSTKYHLKLNIKLQSFNP